MTFQVIGNGTQTMLAFHGFGRDGTDFKTLEPSLGNDFTIISFDLFHHGTSEIKKNNEGTEFNAADLKELINQYLLIHHTERFSLLAYSLGGRISLQLIELFGDKIDTVLLFAPDGLKYSLMYHFITKTKLGKTMFKQFITTPGLFFFLLKLLNKTGIVKNSVFKFLNLQLDTQTKRQRVFDTHLFFRNIHPDLEHVKAIINTKPIKLHLFFGRHDTIIPPRYGKVFMKGINDKRALHILDSGHHLIKDSANEVLKKILNKP